MGNALGQDWQPPVAAGEGLPPHLRLLSGQLADAVAMQAAGIASRSDIDLAMRTLMVERAGHPLGPFALIDLIGLDITVAALASMAATDPDPRLVPAGTLRDLVAEDRLGRKSGRGFHDYETAR